ncbi:YveK family protein [Marinococcus sp. PL1-022]|uniref:YveK family protein n=1 Tax=Marinococcus sp. PL1-022 TaxID=3095363 RepID=UPI0029C108A1|nr:Wzz/FepE/Etk N-terminal domain-containing protein [Marinococcus sp. PL1-022]MDX6153982.1 Wzz/FepE/Etk N-terminal domain-containing protein [Marinococcus sp. PL1-022]
MEETINVHQIFRTIKKRLGIIIGTILVALSLSALATFFLITPQYEASTQVLVNQAQNNEDAITSQELESNREFINTYGVIITSPAILELVIEEMEEPISVGELRNKINVSAEQDSQVANITVEDSDPEQAVALVNALTETFEEEIPGIMEVDNVSILSQAQIENSDSPTSPQPILNLIISIFIGLMAGIGLAFILEYMDKSIKNEQDVEKELALPILGVVPFMSKEENDGAIKSKNSKTSSRLTKRA